MIDMTEAPVTAVLPPRRRPMAAAPLRVYLLGRATVIGFTSVFGAGLFAIWVTFAALSPLTFCAPLVIPLTALTRSYVNAYRGQGGTLGAPIARPYRATTGVPLLRRVWLIVTDPASWRDALWLFLHSIIGTLFAWLQVGFFAAGLLYLSYPFLFWVTPQRAFGQPFGGLVHLHTVAEAAAMMPLALVAFGIWWLIAVPLSRAEAALTRGLLR